MDHKNGIEYVFSYSLFSTFVFIFLVRSLLRSSVRFVFVSLICSSFRKFKKAFVSFRCHQSTVGCGEWIIIYEWIESDSLILPPSIGREVENESVKSLCDRYSDEKRCNYPVAISFVIYGAIFYCLFLLFRSLAARFYLAPFFIRSWFPNDDFIFNEFIIYLSINKFRPI